MNYDKKSASYYSNIRYDLIRLLDKDKKDLKILEVGAGFGETLFYLKEKAIAKEVVGIDIYEDLNNKSKYRQLDLFIFGNIEELDLADKLKYFDVILLPDVLEHIFEPKSVLIKVQNYLKDDGQIIVSMPNIRHYTALYKIFFKGDFKYEESGIFDYTHCRFYCRKNIQELLESSGLKTVYYESSIKNFEGRSISKIFNILTFRIFEEFFSYQYFFKLEKV